LQELCSADGLPPPVLIEEGPAQPVLSEEEWFDGDDCFEAYQELSLCRERLNILQTAVGAAADVVQVTLGQGSAGSSTFETEATAQAPGAEALMFELETVYEDMRQRFAELKRSAVTRRDFYSPLWAVARQEIIDGEEDGGVLPAVQPPPDEDDSGFRLSPTMAAYVGVRLPRGGTVASPARASLKGGNAALRPPQPTSPPSTSSVMRPRRSISESEAAPRLEGEPAKAVKALRDFSVSVEKSRAFPAAFGAAVDVARWSWQRGGGGAAFGPSRGPSMEELMFAVQLVHEQACREVDNLRRAVASRADFDEFMGALKPELRGALPEMPRRASFSQGENGVKQKKRQAPADGAATLERRASGALGKEPGLTATSYASHWGVSMAQLEHFHDDVCDGLEEYCDNHELLMDGNRVIHICANEVCNFDHKGEKTMKQRHVRASNRVRKLVPDMYLLLDREVKPRTSNPAPGRSFALMANPEGLKANVFVTHAWCEPFRELVSTLRIALPADETVWICGLAMNQHEEMDFMDNFDRECPFMVALKQAKRHVVVLGSRVEVTVQRAWCIFEIAKGAEWDIPLTLWFYSAPPTLDDLSEAMEQAKFLDLAEAKATHMDDLDYIHKEVQQIGARTVNERVRDALGDKLRLLESILERGGFLPDGSLGNGRKDMTEHERRLKGQVTLMKAQEAELRSAAEALEAKVESAWRRTDKQSAEKHTQDRRFVMLQLQDLDTIRAAVQKELVEALSSACADERKHVEHLQTEVDDMRQQVTRLTFELSKSPFASNISAGTS